MGKRGILFAATGEAAFSEAARSAARVKELLPGLPVVIASDKDHGNSQIFDDVIVLDDPFMNCGDKIEGMARSPFQETLFLDPDTYLAEEPSAIFEVLARFPLAVSHAPYRDAMPIDGVPVSFPELNTGVIVFRRGEEWETFIQRWKSEYARMGVKADQPSFRKALWEGELSFSVLPTEFQFRTATHCYAGEGEPVRIIHGRHVDVARLAEDLNRSRRSRVYVKSFRSLWTDEVITESRLHRLLKRLFRPFL